MYPSNTWSKAACQVLRFGVVGCFSAVFNFGGYHLVFELFSSIALASVCGYSLGLINSYIAGRKWVFQVERSTKASELLKFIAVYIAGGLFMTLIISVLHYEFAFDYRLAWMFGVVIAVCWNFMGSKFLVYGRSMEAP